VDVTHILRKETFAQPNRAPGIFCVPPPPESLRRQRPVSRILAALGLAGALIFALSVIVGVMPMFLGFRTFVVVSGSMEPTISTGAIALSHSVPSDSLQVGDVIAYSPSSAAALPIIHRIVAITERKGQRYFTTRGDANTGNDAELNLPSSALQVTGSIPFVGYAVYYAAQPWGSVLLVWIPLGMLVGLWIKDRIGTWRSMKAA